MSATVHPAMPVAVTERGPRRKMFTRADVDCMTEAGLFQGQRFELIEGDLIDKMGQNPPHANGIRRLNTWLVKVFGVDRVFVQLPVEIAPGDRVHSLPQPDVTVARELKAEFRERHPYAEELLLVAEVADTSAGFDLFDKARLYARASAPLYWVVDIGRRQLVVHGDPREGMYRSVEAFPEQATVSLDGATALVSDLLP